MSACSIAQVQAMKAELEEALADKIIEFQNNTGLWVSNLKATKLNTTAVYDKVEASEWAFQLEVKL